MERSPRIKVQESYKKIARFISRYRGGGRTEILTNEGFQFRHLTRVSMPNLEDRSVPLRRICLALRPISSYLKSAISGIGSDYFFRHGDLGFRVVVRVSESVGGLRRGLSIKRRCVRAPFSSPG